MIILTALDEPVSFPRVLRSFNFPLTRQISIQISGREILDEHLAFTRLLVMLSVECAP